MHVDDAIRTRRSIRRFLPTPVEVDTLRHLLEVAGRAPSGSNIQPWKVHVVMGRARQRLCDAILEAFDAGDDTHRAEYQYYPRHWFAPYLERRRRCGFGLYETLGIQRDDRERRTAQMRRNYRFFDAPVGLIVTLDRRLEAGSFMDTGMFIQSLLVAARGQGLHSCAQAAFADYHRIIRRQLALADDELVLCGIALGHADPEAPENAFVTERAAVDDFATFHR